jgi:hypothetical protein
VDLHPSAGHFGDQSAIPFVMATERTCWFESLVGQWDENRHRCPLQWPSRLLHRLRRNSTHRIVIVRDWDESEHVTLIKRIAVSRPGGHYGRVLLAKVVDIAFEQIDAWRLWLGVFPDNLRVRRAYEAVGFQAEGVARGSALFGGIYRDELVIVLLRPEWERRRLSIRHDGPQL